MDPGVAGIIGGAVGVVLTGLVRALGIPSEVRRHDAAIRDRDDMLATWIADRDYALKRECASIRGGFGSKSRPSPGIDGYGNDPAADWLHEAQEVDVAVSDARGKALHEYRDREREARLDVATVLAAEGWPHSAWRWLRRQPVPPVATPDKAAPLLDGWRKSSGMNPERWTATEDATKRTLGDALGSMPVTGP